MFDCKSKWRPSWTGILGFFIMSLLPLFVLAQDSVAPIEQFEETLSSASVSDSLTTTGSTVILPLLGYTPDTGLVLGGTLLRFFYLEPELVGSRPSVFSPVFIYTSKQQIMVYLGLGLNWDQDRNALNLVPSFIKFPDQFYGIGRHASLDDEESFTSERLGLDLDINRQVWRNWRLGLSQRLMKHRLAKLDPAGVLAAGSINGTENTWLSGTGPALILDSRDNTWAPAGGWWLQASARFGGTSLGSDYTYQEYTLDLRGYWTVGSDWILAGQFLTTQMEGNVPFFAMPRLGGDEALRGYRGSLFLDRVRALGRFELRRSQLLGSLGAVVFAGLGDVAPSPRQLTLSSELWSAGFGLRYLIDPQEHLNIRLDFGFGNGNSGFYLSLGEAF